MHNNGINLNLPRNGLNIFKGENIMQTENVEFDCRKDGFQLMRIKEVCKITGLTPSSITYLQQNGSFPKSVRLGKKSVAIRSDELNAWIKGLERVEAN